jgi:dUTP pyrophosphatase
MVVTLLQIITLIFCTILSLVYISIIQFLIGNREMISVMKFSQNAIAPTKANGLAGGLDLYSADDVTILPGKISKIRTGVGISLAPGHCGQVMGRSGVALSGLLTVPGT